MEHHVEPFKIVIKILAGPKMLCLFKNVRARISVASDQGGPRGDTKDTEGLHGQNFLFITKLKNSFMPTT